MQWEVDAIIFDLGGVIINLDYDQTAMALSKAMGISPNTLRQAFFDDPTFNQYERGQITDTEFLAFLESFTPRDITHAELTEAWNAMLLDIPAPRIELVQRLAKSHRCFVLSNTNALHIHAFNRILQQDTGYADLPSTGAFEKVYFSHEVGMRKPDAEIYRFVLDDQGLEASRTLFLDDNEANLKGAQGVGIQTQLVTDTETILTLFA